MKTKQRISSGMDAGTLSSMLVLLWLFAGTFTAFCHGTNQHVHSTSYRGRSVVVEANILGNALNISDTGNLSIDGVTRQTTLLKVNVPELATAEVAKALTEGADAVTYSEATVSSLNLTVGGNTIKASIIVTRVSAECCTNVPETRKQSQIVGLVINNQAIEVTGSPNQEIALIGGKIILNELTESITENSADITLNGVHIIINDVANIIISSSKAGVTCDETDVPPPPVTNPPPPPSPEPPPPQGEDCQDNSNGQGWFCPDGENKITFNFCVKVDRKGLLKGRCLIKDKARRVNIRCRRVLANRAIDDITRAIDFEGIANGEPCVTRVILQDAGRSGINDTVQILVTNGYEASGDLGATNPGRGNTTIRRR